MGDRPHQHPRGMSPEKAVEWFASFFEHAEAISPIHLDDRINWPTSETIKRDSRHLSRDYERAMQVHLAFDVPAGPVCVVPERGRYSVVKQPIHLYTRRSNAAYTIDGLRSEIVSPVVGFPRYLDTRRFQYARAFANEPFSKNADPPYTFRRRIDGSVVVELTQLRIEIPRISNFYNEGFVDDRFEGAPFTFDTTYLLLRISYEDDPTIPSFLVLFRSRIVLSGGGDRQDPKNWMPWKPVANDIDPHPNASRDGYVIKFAPPPPSSRPPSHSSPHPTLPHSSTAQSPVQSPVRSRPRSRSPSIALRSRSITPPQFEAPAHDEAPPLGYSRYPRDILHHFGTLLFERGLDRARPAGGSSARSLGHRQQKIYGQRQAQGGIPSLFEDA